MEPIINVIVLRHVLSSFLSPLWKNLRVLKNVKTLSGFLLRGWWFFNLMGMFCRCSKLFFWTCWCLHVFWFIVCYTSIATYMFCLQGLRLEARDTAIVEALLIQGLSSSLIGKSCLVYFGLSMISKRKIWVSFQTQSHQLGSNPRNLWENGSKPLCLDGMVPSLILRVDSLVGPGFYS